MTTDQLTVNFPDKMTYMPGSKSIFIGTWWYFLSYLNCQINTLFHYEFMLLSSGRKSSTNYNVLAYYNIYNIYIYIYMTISRQNSVTTLKYKCWIDFHIARRTVVVQPD